ncbi:MAG: NAD-dependent epimerase/dehydratase family protein [Deltaproteobacteria bacterium]|nr:NAD-dependent epimerase/dehydratase family protein [Deltaproteobacteria bacterium]
MNLNGRKVVLTGVGGFIGLALARRFSAMGAIVHGLDMSKNAVLRAKSQGVLAEVGDVCSSDSVRNALEGAELVVHTAAVVGEGGDFAHYERINVGGTRNVLAAAAHHGVAMVHLSSVMVYGFTYPEGVTEEGPFRGEGNAYCETKLRSDHEVLAAAERGQRALVIRPGDVYGVGSVPWVIRPVDMLRKGLFVLPDGGRGLINHVHLENLVDALVAAVTRDAWGRAFNVTDGVRTSNLEYFTRLAALIGVPKVRTAPAALLRPLFAMVARGARLLGREPPATEEAVNFLMRDAMVSSARAQAELAWKPKITLEDGMREIARSLRNPSAI